MRINKWEWMRSNWIVSVFKFGFYCMNEIVIPTYYLVGIKIFPPRKTWGLQYSHIIQGNSETLTEMCETFKLYWQESSFIYSLGILYAHTLSILTLTYITFSSLRSRVLPKEKSSCQNITEKSRFLKWLYKFANQLLLIILKF